MTYKILFAIALPETLDLAPLLTNSDPHVIAIVTVAIFLLAIAKILQATAELIRALKQNG